jgi:ribosomal protein L29
MKKNDLAELKNLDAKALFERVKKARTEMADLVMDKNMSTLKNLKQMRNKRKDLAQILTIHRQKEIIAQLEKGAN